MVKQQQRAVVKIRQMQMSTLLSSTNAVTERYQLFDDKQRIQHFRFFLIYTRMATYYFICYTNTQVTNKFLILLPTNNNNLQSIYNRNFYKATISSHQIGLWKKYLVEHLSRQSSYFSLSMSQYSIVCITVCCWTPLSYTSIHLYRAPFLLLFSILSIHLSHPVG